MNIIESTRSAAGYTGNALSASGRYLTRTIVKIGDLTGINALINRISTFSFGSGNQSSVASRPRLSAKSADISQPTTSNQDFDDFWLILNAKSVDISQPTTSNQDLDFARMFFTAQGINPEALCPHGVPTYSCMPCSH